MAQFLDDFYLTTVEIALSSIQSDLGVATGILQWVISAYVLTFGGLLLLSGVCADMYGRKLVFCIGMANLTVWSLANGFAGSFIQLTVFRALQGIGAAMTILSALGIITNFFVEEDRLIAVTLFGASGGIGFSLGLITGGFLTASLGWRYVFYIPASVTGMIFLLACVTLPDSKQVLPQSAKLDYSGAAISTAGLVLFTFVISSGGLLGWSSALIIALLALSICLLCGFVWREANASNPIMPLYLWKLPNFAASWLSVFSKLF